MNALEKTYRRALRWYPMRWRSANEDAVLGTLLDRAEEQNRAAPARGELANLRASGLQTHFGRVGAAIPRDVRVRAAIIAIALGFTIATAGGIANSLMFRYLASEYPPFARASSGLGVSLSFYGLWFAAFVFQLVGLRRFAMGFIVTSLPFSIAIPIVNNYIHIWASPGAVTMGFLDLLAIVYLCGVPKVNARTRATLAIVSAALVTSFLVIYWAKTVGYWGNGALGVDWYWGQFAVWLTFLGIPAAVVASIIMWRVRRTLWAPAILLAMAPVVPLALFEFGYATSWLDNSAAAVATLVIVAIAIGILRLFGLRLRLTRN